MRIVPCYHPPIGDKDVVHINGIRWLAPGKGVCAVCDKPVVFDEDAPDAPKRQSPKLVRYGKSQGRESYVDATIPPDRRTTVQVVLDVHPHIAILACAMQRKLERDHDKGNWDKLDVYECVDGIAREMRELVDAPPAEAFDEAADVANWAMFAAGVIVRNG